MKKIALIFMSMLVALNLIMPPEVAHANLITKPIAVAAKKAAKDLAKDTAVEMANQIVADFLVRELIEGIQKDDGYSAVCMDGKKSSISDCAPEKQAQIKTNLSSADKANLEAKVEAVLERKTGTSSKWGKFLDYFVPIFLVGGATTLISAAFDGDVLSFFDDIAQQALIDAGYLKPLSYVSPPAGDYDNKDFRNIVQSAKVLRNENQIILQMTFFTNKDFTINYIDSYGDKERKIFKATNNEFILYFNPTFDYSADRNFVIPKLTLLTSTLGALPSGGRDLVLFVGAPVPNTTANKESATESARMEIQNIKNRYFNISGTDVNSVINQFFASVTIFTNMSDKVKFEIDLPKSTPIKPPSHTDYGQQTATEKLKDPDGNVQIKGPGAFTFTHGDKEVYPSPKSETGWRDMTTGKDIVVIEDNIVVEERDPSLPPPKPPEGTEEEEEETEVPPSCPKLKKPNFKAFTKSFTTAFPFSIPWDIGRAIDAAFGGIGSKKPEFDLNPLIPAKLTIPDYFDSWMPFVRTIILLAFDAGLIYLFARFMGRGGGD